MLKIVTIIKGGKHEKIKENGTDRHQVIGLVGSTGLYQDLNFPPPVFP